MKPLIWSYGVTTVPSRKDTLLPRTLLSLRAAGFDNPRLFVDGVDATARDQGYWVEHFGLETTVHTLSVLAYGNWILALWELYIRDPGADRYAIFQDDLVIYPHLREYLEQTPYPERGYLNLYLFPENELLCPINEQGGYQTGWYPSNQKGKGAVALIFDNEACMTLLSSPHMVKRVKDANRGTHLIDGGVVEAMTLAGYREYTHYPSLTQHTGDTSAIGQYIPRHGGHVKAPSFRGEDFDARTLLPAHLV